MRIPNKFDGFSRDGRRLYPCGGGKGGSDNYYENLNVLYEKQADMADLYTGVARDTVIPEYRGLVDEARGFDSDANREIAAQRAGADVIAAAGTRRQMLADDMASMGINPADERWMRQMRGLEINDAAQQAAAMTGARDRVSGLGRAMRMDTAKLGMGISGDATTALQTAGQTAGSVGNLQQQQQANQNAAIGNAVAGGMTAYKLFMADGGYVSKRGIPRGPDGAQKLFMGGSPVKGGFGPKSVGAAPPPPPVGAPPQPQGGGATLMAAQSGAGRQMLSSGVEGVGNAVGSPEMAAFGKGMGISPAQAQIVADAYTQAGAMVDAAMMEGAGGMAMTGAEAAGVAGAATEGAAATAAAAELGGVGSALSAGSVVGAAMPWVGGALLAGSALGLFKDGGRVNGTHGGEVDGPGGPHDDAIPAWLSDGEYVLNAEAVQHFGLDKLHKMNQRGLEIRKGMSR